MVLKIGFGAFPEHGWRVRSFQEHGHRMGTDEWMRGAGALACGANTENREKGGTEN